MVKNFMIAAALILSACGKTTEPVVTDVGVCNLCQDAVDVPSDLTSVVDTATEVTEAQEVTTTQVP